MKKSLLLFFSLIVVSCSSKKEHLVSDLVHQGKLEYEVFWNDSKVGTFESRLGKKNKKWVLVDEMKITLKRGGQEIPLEVSDELVMNNDFSLESLKLKQPNMFYFVSVENGEVKIFINGVEAKSFSVDSKIYIDSAVIYNIMSRISTVRVGDCYEYDVLSINENTVGKMNLKLESVSNGIYKFSFVERVNGRESSKGFYAVKDGRVVESVMEVTGLVSIRTVLKGFSSKSSGSSESLDVLYSLGAVNLPFSVPLDMRKIVFEVEHKNVKVLSFITNRFQKVVLLGDRAVLTVSGRNIGRFDKPSEEQVKKNAEFLGRDPFVNPNNSEIIEKAKSLRRESDDFYSFVNKVVAFVVNYLEDTYETLYLSSDEAWKEKKGDCTEHAVLATALFRAVGVPARPVVGAVVLGDKMMFHAWVEVLSSKGWVEVDPVFGQVGVDANHIRFLCGHIVFTTQKFMPVYRVFKEGRLALKEME